jgi:large subunit ribosomal protein L25
MKHLNLKTDLRTHTGHVVRKLRKQSIIPAVIYGKSLAETIQIQLDLNTFLKLFRQSGRTTVIDVDFGDKSLPCLIHKVDLHPVTDVVRHIDFLVVDLKAKTTADVPITFIGEPSKASEGVLLKQLSSIEVEALPEKIPREIQVDLTKLQAIGDSIHVSDLVAGNDFIILTESETVIAALIAQVEEKEEIVEITPETLTDAKSTTTTPS